MTMMKQLMHFPRILEATHGAERDEMMEIKDNDETADALSTDTGGHSWSRT